MAVVYRARNIRLDKTVAIKMLSEKAASRVGLQVGKTAVGVAGCKGPAQAVQRGGRPGHDRGPDGDTGTALHAAGDENHWAFSTTIGFDSRDNPYYPRRGLLAQTTLRSW